MHRDEPRVHHDLAARPLDAANPPGDKREKEIFMPLPFVLRIAALALLAASAVPAWSQAYPSRPVTLIVSSAPGAGVDFFARILAEKLRTRVGQPVVVENRPGASGMVAAGLAAKAAPDGHTLFLMPNTLVIAPYVLSSGAATVNVMTELVPVVLPVATLMVLAVNGKLGVAGVPELVALAKKQPGLHYAAGDNGSPMHVLGEQLGKRAGVDMTFVPYKGVAQSVAATLGGQVNVIWMPSSSNVQHFRSGALRAIAHASPRRSPLLPGVPTMIELGYKDIEAVAWFGMLAPLSTPPGVIGRMNKEVNAVLAAADVRESLLSAGYVPEGGSPEALGAQMRADDVRYRGLIAELGIKAD
jgi:tripartite-type tricarboxylate transporter receptor subunit TctC